MTSLTAIFGSTEEDSGDSEKLLELYWNRAELKKEFASLRDETFRLKNLVKEKEGVSARFEQKLEHLENLLLDPEWVYNVLVYYQLRAFNQRCQRKLARFAEQLKQQREKRQHGKILDAWNEKNAEEARQIQVLIGEQRMSMQLLEDQLQSERHRFSMMGGFMRFFRKRGVTRRLDDIAERIEVSRQQELQHMQALEALEGRCAPDTTGLSIRDKRSINFMILAFAQQMYLQYSEDNLAGLAKEAGDKSVGAINYGSKTDCDLILKIVREHGDAMDKATDFADDLKRRAKLLAEKSLFQNDDDAVPVPGSVATVYDFAPDGTPRECDANLVGENYWRVAEIFSR